MPQPDNDCLSANDSMDNDNINKFYCHLTENLWDDDGCSRQSKY